MSKSLGVRSRSSNSKEVLNVKLRYKTLTSNTSLLLTKAVTDNNNVFASSTDDFRLAATVAGFGMLLRHSDLVSGLSYAQLIDMARKSRGTDEEGYRAELVRLLEMSELLQNK